MTAAARRASVANARVGSAPAMRAGPEPGSLSLVVDPLRVALFVLTILTISRIHEHYPLLARFRPALLLVVASVGYAYLNPRYLTRANVFAFWPMRVLVVLGILACCSAAFGISLGASATFILASYVKTLAYAFLIAVAIRHVTDLFTFVWAYVISCGILAFFSLFVFGMSKSVNSRVSRLNNLYTYDSNDLCVVMMVGLPLTLLLLSVERGVKRWILTVILIGISMTVARSGSRGGFLGFVAVGMAALILLDGVSASRRLVVAGASVIALAVAAPAGYWEQMATILEPKSDYNYYDREGRKAVMQRGIGYMAQYPAFGLGISNFDRAECTISPKIEGSRLNGPLRCTAPHNSYVEAGSELGYPGLAVWGGLVIGLIIAPLRLRRRLARSLRRGTDAERFLYGATSYFSVAGVGFAVTSFFVSFAWMDIVYLMAAFLTGLYISVRAQASAGADGGAGQSAPVAPSRLPGWRVRQSAQRAPMGRPR